MQASRKSISAIATATSVGFSAAKIGTNLAFGIARSISSLVASGVGTTFDYVFLGQSNGTGATLGFAITSAFNVVENLALAPILIGETLTSTSLVAASGSLDALSSIFGSDEASFSLSSFVQLVRREWSSPALAEHLPKERYSVTAMSRALMALAAIQGITQDYQEQKWFSAIRELTDEEKEWQVPNTRQAHEQVNVTEDVVFPDQNGHIMLADIGKASSSGNTIDSGVPSGSYLLSNLRRFSKLSLAGYGGAGMIFFGVPLRANAPAKTSNADKPATSVADQLRTDEASVLENVVSSSQQDTKAEPRTTPLPQPRFSWWNVLLGKHDREIFESYAFSLNPADVADPRPPSNTLIGTENRMPRFWVLTDHGRKEVVLVIRGTMSLNELAIDLTCDPENFEPASSSIPREPDEDIPGFLFNPPPSVGNPDSPHQVHSGILKIAMAMGERGKPVHTAVRKALRRTKDYTLVLCGHSLGAGIAGLLAMMWADPRTCLTVAGSGLPVGRKVSGYLFAPPCLTSEGLSSMCRSLLTSFVYSHDIVSRLSLGSIRDLTRAAMWLCAGKGDESPVSILKRALALRNSYTRPADTQSEVTWFLSLRKTLEANMCMAHLYPPGRVLWAINDQDLQPSFRLEASSTTLRLFEVLHIDKVFNQIVFSRNMLGSHMPHQYDRVVHELT